MMRVKPDTVEWLLENSELMGSVNSTSALSHRWQTAGLRCAGRWDFDRRRNNHEYFDFVSLSNDSMSTRGKAFTDRAKSLDIQLYM